jgi:hypothetical protein
MCRTDRRAHETIALTKAVVASKRSADTRTVATGTSRKAEEGVIASYDY